MINYSLINCGAGEQSQLGFYNLIQLKLNSELFVVIFSHNFAEFQSRFED